MLPCRPGGALDKGCCSPHDPATTTGLNDACAVGKEGCRNRAAIDVLIAKLETLALDTGGGLDGFAPA